MFISLCFYKGTVFQFQITGFALHYHARLTVLTDR